MTEMRNRPFFSIVVPAHNRHKLVERAINSIFAQTFYDYEIILIDDVSAPPLDSLISLERNPCLQIIRPSCQKGGSEARNIGIRLARGQYIAFLDSDDYWNVDKLEICHNALASNNFSNTVLIHSSIIAKKSGHMVVNKLSINRAHKFSNFLEFIVLGDALLQTSALIVEANICKRCQFQKNLKRHQDLDFYINLASEYPRCLFLAAALSTWDISHEQASISQKSDCEYSLSWIKTKKELITDKVFYSFVLKFIFLRNMSKFLGPEFSCITEGLKHKHISFYKTASAICVKLLRFSQNTLKRCLRRL